MPKCYTVLSNYPKHEGVEKISYWQFTFGIGLHKMFIKFNPRRLNGRWSSMASLLSPAATISVRHQVNRLSFNSTLTNTLSKILLTTIRKGRCNGLSFMTKMKMSVEGGVLEKEPARDSDKSIMVSTSKLLPLSSYSHFAWTKTNDYEVVSVHQVGILCENLESSLEFYQNILGISYMLSKSGRPAIFTRDQDANALEFTQVDS